MSTCSWLVWYWGHVFLGIKMLIIKWMLPLWVMWWWRYRDWLASFINMKILGHNMGAFLCGTSRTYRCYIHVVQFHYVLYLLECIGGVLGFLRINYTVISMICWCCNIVLLLIKIITLNRIRWWPVSYICPGFPSITIGQAVRSVLQVWATYSSISIIYLISQFLVSSVIIQSM